MGFGDEAVKVREGAVLAFRCVADYATFSTESERKLQKIGNGFDKVCRRRK